MSSVRRLLAGLRSRHKTHLALTITVVSVHSGVIGAAAAPALADMTTPSPPAACTHVSDNQGQCRAASDEGLQIRLTEGAQQCPDSGTAAACSNTAVAVNDNAPGAASTPDGQTQCPAATDVALTSAAACTDAVLPAMASNTGAGSGDTPSVTPSVPISSLQLVATTERVDLAASTTAASPGQKVALSATATRSVTGTGTAIEIFDQTAGTLVGACTRGSQCIVNYAAPLGTHHFVAFIIAPASKVPADNSGPSSNAVTVSWMNVRLEAKNAVVGQGKTLTITATSSIPTSSRYTIQIFDASSKSRLTYCAHGNTCSVSVLQPASGQRSIIAALARPSTSFPAAETQAQSDPLTLTWLGVSIASGAAYQIGGIAHLTATASADLTDTPWSLGILDDKGRLIGQPCKSGSTCSAQVALDPGQTPSFTAIIGAVPNATDNSMLGQLLKKVAGPADLVDVQVRSNPVKPSRLLWGVDSCKTFTDDPTGNSGLYPHISGLFGAPDFWGRYLTDAVCPPLSGTEVAAAHARHMGILPIYNERDCSNVSGYETGMAYAAEAIASAQAIGLPQGRGIAIDIEPSGPACPGAANLDTGLIHGWYDGITAAGYAPIYYGNGNPGSEFATQWCYTVNALPYVAVNSYVWSFQPSLLGDYRKSSAPGFGPALTGCAGHATAWQYQIGSSSNITDDVDSDEATSDLPIWFP